MDSGNLVNQFRDQIDKATKKGRKFLEASRNITLPEDVKHVYDDKFLCVERITMNSIKAISNALEFIGFTNNIRSHFQKQSVNENITLRFSFKSSFEFIRKEEKLVKLPNTVIISLEEDNIETSGYTMVSTLYFEYHFYYDFVVFVGNDVNNGTTIHSGSCKTPFKTRKEQNGFTVSKYFDINITWLLHHLDSDGDSIFKIIRQDKSCHTPRRNNEVNSAHDFFLNFITKAKSILKIVKGPFENAHLIFHGAMVPVLPFMINDDIVSSKDQDNLFKEQISDLKNYIQQSTSSFMKSHHYLETAKCQIIMHHIEEIILSFFNGIQNVEDLMKKQLTEALGTELSTSDINEYMMYHYRHLYKKEYQPIPFVHSIRNGSHSPEGTICITKSLTDNNFSYKEPILTSTRILNSNTIQISINASTTLQFKGQKYLHGYLGTKCDLSMYDTSNNVNLDVKAKQFSCYIVVLGTVVSKDKFEPRNAVIVRNNDEYNIPLYLELLPTPKEFENAIESLSPEQVEFANAFREMQLSNSMFGICVIQIKPQLEKVLNLPKDSLTKEIQLCESLINLFIKYQIPTDLISYDGNENETVQHKIQRVKELVSSIEGMIKQEIDEEIKEAQKTAMKIIVKTLTGKTLILSGIQDTTTIFQIKKLIQSQEGIPIDQQRLIFNGVQLRDDNYCYLYGIQENSLLHLMLRLCGGGVRMTDLSGDQRVNTPLKRTRDSSQDVNSEPPIKMKKLNQSIEEVDTEKIEFETSRWIEFPFLMNTNLRKFDREDSLHTTIFKSSDYWSGICTDSILSKPKKKYFAPEKVCKFRNNAFDLLDALSRGGTLSLDFGSLHILTAVTHCFDDTILNTITKQNVNPIQSLERSSLILLSTIFQKSPKQLINDSITLNSELLE